MRRTFVYKAPSENRPPLASKGDSLRKRKRSPESSHHDTVGAKKPMGNGIIVINDDDASPGGEDDYLDEIGTAAIELYELTQRDPEAAVDSTTTTAANVPQPEDTALQAGHEQLLAAKRGVPTTVARANAATTQTTLPISPPSQQQQQQQLKQLQAAAITLISAHSNTLTPAPLLPLSAGTLPPPPAPAELLEKLRELREVNYCKDGEVKVLRSEKERLVEELRKKEEAARDVQTRLLSEKEELEQRHAREKEAMTTTLKFSEQELVSLQERCRLLEDKLKRSNQQQQQQQQQQLLLPTPTKSGTAAAGAIKVPPLDGRDSSAGTGDDFMSIEATALCSQSSALPAISVGSKRPSSMLEPSLNSFKTSSQGHHQKKPMVHALSSSSPSYQPHLSSNGGMTHPLENAMVFRHVKQEEGTTTPITLPLTTITHITLPSTTSPTTLPPNSFPVPTTPTQPAHTTTLVSQTAPTAPPKEATQQASWVTLPPDGDWDYKPVALDVPELNGPQLLMLLANPGLNRPPPSVAMETTSGPQATTKGGKLLQRTRTRSHMAGEEEGNGEENTPLPEPWSPESPQKLTGLLSLLHLKTPTSIFPVNTRALFASVLPLGEVRGDHLRPDSLMKKIRHASSVVRRGATEMEPNPVGRFEPDSSGPASRGHALSSPSSSTRGVTNSVSEGFGPQTRIDAFEEWNPTKSTSLARGVDPNRLEEHINLILNSAETTATGSSQISSVFPFSSPAPSSPSLSPRRPYLPHQGVAGDMALSLLPSLGDVLVRYHAEQLLKTHPPLDATTGQLDCSGGEGAGHLNASTSASSRSSGEEGVVRSEVNYKVLLEAVSALETLVVCSGRVRMALLAPPPPPFKLESRPSSVIGQASVAVLRGGGGHRSGDSPPTMVARSTPVGRCVTTPLRAGLDGNNSAEKEVTVSSRVCAFSMPLHVHLLTLHHTLYTLHTLHTHYTIHTTHYTHYTLATHSGTVLEREKAQFCARESHSICIFWCLVRERRGMCLYKVLFVSPLSFCVSDQ